jgi:hypothetical protein
METKHTPGPWSLSTINYYTNEGQTGVFKDEERICLVDSRDESIKRKDKPFAEDKERSANAKLIASAPEMLEVLMELVNKHPQMPNY